MEQVDVTVLSKAIEAIKDLSAPTSTKWSAFYSAASDLFGISTDQAYVTYISNAANTQVRINKQMPNDRQVKVAFGVCGSADWDSTSYEKQAIRSIKDRMSLNCIIFMWQTGSADGSRWQVCKCFCRSGSREAQLAKSLWPELELIEVTSPLQQPHMHFNAVDSDFAEQVVQLLQWNKNVLLEGVPGTGKSYAINGVAEAWQSITGRSLSEVTVIVLHPSTAYEDLVEGLRPAAEVPENDFLSYPHDVEADTSFRPRLGRLADVAVKASFSPESDHLVVLDELNRANVPRALGELMLVMESTKRATWVENQWLPSADGQVRLTYSGVKFWLPDNLYILATMNTSDRSTAPLDSALRRRFLFKRIEPMSLIELQGIIGSLEGDSQHILRNLSNLWATINETLLRPLIGPDAVLGHSYLFGLHGALSNVTPGSEVEVGRSFLRYVYLPQLIDVVMANGREVEFFGSGINVLTEDQLEAMKFFRLVLQEFELEVFLQGEGLSRRIVVEDVPPSTSTATVINDASE